MKQRLRESLIRHAAGGVALAFSGGVDSTLLLHALLRLRAEGLVPDLLAYYFQSKLQPAADAAEVAQIASAMEAPLEVISIDPLADLPNLRSNPVDRCYHCKRLLFSKLIERARAHGLYCIMDGTNADDLKVYRPGLQALRELGVVSMLAEAGMNKADVRLLAAEWGLSCATKPSSPCLATRFEYGSELTEEGLRRVEHGEDTLRRLFPGAALRLRVHGDLARVELPKSELNRAVDLADSISSALHALGFTYITLDLEGMRSGSMDAALPSLPTSHR